MYSPPARSLREKRKKYLWLKLCTFLPIDNTYCLSGCTSIYRIPIVVANSHTLCSHIDSSSLYPLQTLIEIKCPLLSTLNCTEPFMFRLISTSELYSTGATVSSGGTLPKMSFAMMKEENSRLDKNLN